MLNTYWDVWNHVLERHEEIRVYRDKNTRSIYMTIHIIGVALLRQLAFKNVHKLIDFLRRLELTD